MRSVILGLLTFSIFGGLFVGLRSDGDSQPSSLALASSLDTATAPVPASPMASQTSVASPSPPATAAPLQTQARPAFPGAEGFGALALARCERSEVQVLRVTTTASLGPGSLAEALERNNPDQLSVIVFTIGGTIRGSHRLDRGCLILAGQTAPGGGVQLYSNGNAVLVFDRRGGATDIVIRHLRVRSDKGTPGKQDAISIQGGRNIVFDHVSVQFANDEVFSITPVPTDLRGTSVANITIQRTLIAAGLRPHSVGSLLKPADDHSTTVSRISLHHNLWAHNAHRNPRIRALTETEIVNNVVYNYRNRATRFSEGARVDVVGNYYLAGPWTGKPEQVLQHDRDGKLSRLYLSGNLAPAFQADPNGAQQNLIRFADTKGRLPDRGFAQTRQFHPTIPVSEQTARQAFDGVVADVGANARLSCEGEWIRNSDSLDRRILGHVVSGTGPASDRAVDHPDDFGGVPQLDEGVPCADSDQDGMPDEFEVRFSLDESDASDASGDPDGDGYSNIEEYINGTDPRS